METMLARSQIKPSSSMMFSFTKTHHLTNHPFLFIIGPTTTTSMFALETVTAEDVCNVLKSLPSTSKTSVGVGGISYTVSYEKLVQEW